MGKISFADVVYEAMEFDPGVLRERLIVDLLDTPWVQRLRDVSQTGNTKLVYMYSEHSRFGHSLGVAYLACRLLKNLEHDFKSQVEKYSLAICAAALLHDIAHLAPGSHTAVKAWFPGKPDTHEQTALRIISSDSEIKRVLESYQPGLTEQVKAVISESDNLPPWTWQILSGGGWNVDRGNWCMADSILAGVSYGKYNIAALINAISISDSGELALHENRLDAMLHFAISRHAMYKQIYQHRVMLAADKLIARTIKRCRDLGGQGFFADEVMQRALKAESVEDLSVADICEMREGWWRYHLLRWRSCPDAILADLSSRLINRKLLKTVAVTDEEKSALLPAAREAVLSAGFNPDYYLYEISSSDTFVKDSTKALKVITDSGSVRLLQETDSIFQSIVKNAMEFKKSWLVLPAEAKARLNRSR